jgi:general secretion pathway protein A
MYTSYYGFREKPFKLVPDPRFLYLSEAHKVALSHLKFGIEDRNGFVVITGEVGSGKTLLLRVLMNDLPSSTQVARIINTNFNAKELLEHVLNEFGVEVQREKSKPKLLSMLTKVLVKAFSEEREAILVIDEAQNLSIDALEELRMISNLETNTEKLVQIVMVGQPQLRYKLNLPILEQLRQRITVQYHLGPLDDQETFAYVNHRLKVAAGKAVERFTPEALQQIYVYSGGIPRLINVVSDAALRLGYVEDVQMIDERILRDVIDELQEIGEQEGNVFPPRQVIASPLDQNAIELNKKFQSLYNDMQVVYANKEEDSLLFYERLLNREMERLHPRKEIHSLRAREEMLYKKEQEIHQKLMEVASRLDEVNTIKEDLEEKKVEVQKKVAEVDRHLQQIRQWKPREGQKTDRDQTDQLLKQKMEQFEGIQERLQLQEEDLSDKMEELRGVLRELEQKKALLDSLGKDKSVEERLRELENQQSLVRRKEEELVGRLAMLEKEMKAESQMRAEQKVVKTDGLASGIKDQDFLQDLIQRVEGLKAEIDALDFQKKLIHAATDKEEGIQSRLEQVEQNYLRLKEKEESLLERITSIQESSRILANKTVEVDAITEKVVSKEKRLEKKLGELRELILTIEKKMPASLSSDTRTSLLSRKKADASVEAAEPEGELPEEAVSPGRHFNFLIRKILKQS